MKSKRTVLIVILLGIVLLAVLGFVGAQLFAPYEYHGAILQSPLPAQDFTLMGHMGQRMSLSDFRGKIVLLYFGYTTCPDVCPTTLADLAKARKLLGKDGEQIQVLMITVDPERDTLPVLADYITHFNSSFIALRGTQDELAQIATPLGIYYERENSDSALGYLMNHTATVMGIDRNGYLRVVFPFGTSAENIAEDLRHLMQK